MKATGIVRRIDELGRVVIPKEIRRTLHIREGAPLEIYTESDGRVIFKKFSPVDEFVAVAEQYADVVSAALKMTVAICDRDRFVAVKGNRREVQDAAVSAALDDLLHGKKSHFGEIDRTISVCDGVEAKALAVYPIKVTGDVVGAIAVLERDSEQPPLDMGEQRLVSVCATLLARQIEG